MSELPNGWASTALGSVSDLIMGQSPPGEFTNNEGQGLPLLGGAADYAGETLSASRFTSTPTKVCNPGDIILCIRATIGRTAFADRRYCLGRGVAGVRSYVEATWLRHKLRESANRLDAAGVGTTFRQIDKRTLEDWPILLPPLPEQRRIVAKIDSLSAKSGRARDHLDHLPRLVEKYKQALLTAAFRGELTREWRKVHRCENYRRTRLAELLSVPVRNGLSVRGSDRPPGVRALRLSALRGGSVDLSDIRYLPITEEHAARFQLAADDVLVSRGNGTKAFVGLAAIVGTVQETTIFPDTAFRLRFKRELARPSWISRIWNASPIRQQIEAFAKTTAGIWKIAQYDLDKIDLLLPHPLEQDEIVRRIEFSFKWIDRLASEAKSARKLVDHLDQAVLAKAFRGELVPQDPSDEPASVLLERIRAARTEPQRSSGGRGRASRTA